MDKEILEDREKERQYAKKHGLFWLPCPICGEYFGGHEATGAGLLDEPDGSRRLICKNCGEDGEPGYRFAYCGHCKKRSKFGLPEARAEKPIISTAPPTVGQMVVTVRVEAKCLECELGLLRGESTIRLYPWYYPTA